MTFDREAFNRVTSEFSKLRRSGTLTKERWLELLAEGERAAGDMPFMECLYLGVPPEWMVSPEQ